MASARAGEEAGEAGEAAEAAEETAEAAEAAEEAEEAEEAERRLGSTKKKNKCKTQAKSHTESVEEESEQFRSSLLAGQALMENAPPGLGQAPER